MGRRFSMYVALTIFLSPEARVMGEIPAKERNPAANPDHPGKPLDRVVQRPRPRRAAEHPRARLPHQSQRRHRGLEDRVQHLAAPLSLHGAHPRRVRCPMEPPTPASTPTTAGPTTGAPSGTLAHSLQRGRRAGIAVSELCKAIVLVWGPVVQSIGRVHSSTQLSGTVPTDLLIMVLD